MANWVVTGQRKYEPRLECLGTQCACEAVPPEILEPVSVNVYVPNDWVVVFGHWSP